MIATIFLPAFVTVIPTYTFFQRIGWVGTWLPLIVPTFFANAFDVFLLRQYFMTIPRDGRGCHDRRRQPLPRPVVGDPSPVLSGLAGSHACSTSSMPGTTSSGR